MTNLVLPRMPCRGNGHQWRRRRLMLFLRMQPRRATCRRCGCIRERLPDGGFRYTYPGSDT